MRKIFKSFFGKTLLWFFCCSFIILFSSCIMVRSSLATVYLFNIPVPKYFPQLLGLIWIATFVFSIFALIKNETKKTMPKICFLLLLLCILFAVTSAGFILIGAAQNGLDYYQAFSSFLVQMPLSRGAFFGAASVVLDLALIMISIDTAKKYIKSKTSRHVVPLTIVISILLVIVIIAVQNVLYDIIESWGFPYARNVFETIFSMGTIVIYLIWVRKHIKNRA